MQKKYLTIAVASTLASISVANAEKSGAFAGLEAGVNIAPRMEFYDNNQPSSFDNFMLGGTYGVVAGYKQFFTPYIGVRYYANFNYKHINRILGITPVFSVLNYGANIDFLGNFVSSEDLDFGGFVGLGLGGNTSIRTATATSLDVALNFGLRATFDSGSLELVARASFLPTILQESQWGAGLNLITYSHTYHHYGISVRYTYNF